MPNGKRNGGEVAVGSPAESLGRCSSAIQWQGSADEHGRIEHRHPSGRDRQRLILARIGFDIVVGASLLRAYGFTDVSDLIGGYAAWETHCTA